MATSPSTTRWLTLTDASSELKGKVAIVTGGSRGIGAATSLKLAQAGADVAIIHQSDKSPTDLEKSLAKYRSRVLMIDNIDVSDASRVKRAVESTKRKFGQIDILVNNAGIYAHSLPEKTSEDEWDKIMGVNLRGAFLFSREVGKVMIKGGRGGRIVNISSIDAFQPEYDFPHYDASKAGLVGLTRSLALSWGRYGICVNAVAPGLVDTGDLWKVAKRRAEAFKKASPLHAVVELDDVASAILFLCLKASSKITGQTLVVDSGVSLTGYMALAKS